MPVIQEPSKKLKKGDKGNIIYTHIVISYSIIVSFAWDVVTGQGEMDPADQCHGVAVKDGEVRIRLTKVNPPTDSFHPISKRPLEAGTWAIIPIERLLL